MNRNTISSQLHDQKLHDQPWDLFSSEIQPVALPEIPHPAMQFIPQWNSDSSITTNSMFSHVISFSVKSSQWYGTASCLILSYLINHASPILSNELSNTSVWMLWNSSLFHLLHFIIVWSCGHYYKVWQLLGITSHCWLNAKPLLHTAYTQTLSLFSQTIFLHSYFLICSFFYTLSSYLLISDSSDSRIIFHWRISGLYLIGW